MKQAYEVVCVAMILTLDLGTTYFKAALFDRAGQLCALHREAPPITHPQKDYWELDVDCFCETVCRAIQKLVASPSGNLRDVEAVCFATQTNSFVLLGERDQPLTPLILWPDLRARDMTDELSRLEKMPDLQATTGAPSMQFYRIVMKLGWLREHHTDLWSRIRRFCLISDYLTLWLTGQHVTEAGAAGLTSTIDIHRLQWWPAMCETLRLDSSWLPEIQRAGTDLGPILPAIADKLGLPRTCRFVVGCLDQYAGAIGAGNITPGRVSETTGTVLATVRCADRFSQSAPAGVFQGPAFDSGIYYQMVFGETSANLLEWYRNQLADRPDFDLLGRAAAEVLPGAEGLRARPRADLGGLADGFVGMKESRSTGHATRAIMETVAFALADQVKTLCGSQMPAEIRSSGGAARSDLWLQIKADVLNTPFLANACPEPTSLGAAMLAARALGWGNLAELARAWIQTRPARIPDRATHQIYQSLQSSFERPQ